MFYLNGKGLGLPCIKFKPKLSCFGSKGVLFLFLKMLLLLTYAPTACTTELNMFSTDLINVYLLWWF